LKAIADFAQGVLGRNVRIARPRGLTGLPDAQSSCAFATLAGLALFAAEDVPDLWNKGPSIETPSARSGGGRWLKMFDRLKSSI
jgi:cell division protein FtsA